MNDLILTDDELRKIAQYAHSAQSNDSIDAKELAEALEIVALCMLRLQIGEPPRHGSPVDQWYDEKFGIQVRQRAFQLDPAVQKLRDAGIIENK